MPNAVAQYPRTRVLISQFPTFTLRVGNHEITSSGTCREVFLSRIQREFPERALKYDLLHNKPATMILRYRRAYVENPALLHYSFLAEQNVHRAIRRAWLEGDPTIRQITDRVVGTMCTFMFPKHRSGNFRIYPDGGDVHLSYDIPATAMSHPAFIHLLFGMGRECHVLATQYAEYFVPVATDEEVERALQGDVELARDIFSLLLPNLKKLSRSVRNQYKVFRYLLRNKLTASQVFGGRSWHWAWHGRGCRYWDADAHKVMREVHYQAVFGNR